MRVGVMVNIRTFWNAIKFVGDWIIDGGDTESLIAVLEHGTCGSLRTGGGGHRWEQVLISECKLRGFTVCDVSAKRMKYDLVVGDGDLRVQCKFLGQGNADIKPRGRDRNGIRKYHVDDFDVLAVACRNTDTRYFIPSTEIADRDGWLSTTFRPEYCEWRDAWEVFDGECPDISGRLF